VFNFVFIKVELNMQLRQFFENRRPQIKVKSHNTHLSAVAVVEEIHVCFLTAKCSSNSDAEDSVLCFNSLDLATDR